MKHIHIILEDEEYEELERVKGGKTWKMLLLSTLEKESGKP